MNFQTTMILVRGLPGSGKSTIASLLAKKGSFRWHEADHFFLNEEGDYLFDQKKLPEAHDYCQRQTRESLEMGYSVVISNTFSRRWEMQPYLDMAKERGLLPIVIEAKNVFGNVHSVPQEVINRMEARWESYP